MGMKKTMLLLAALSTVVAGSLQANAAPTPKPQIEDPLGDANFANDQGTGDGSTGDHAAGADAGNASDLNTVTISNDAKNVYVMFMNEQAPPATQGMGLRLRVNGKPGSQCLNFEVFYAGATNNLAGTEAQLRDSCTGETVPIEVVGTMLTIPRSAHEAFGKGQTLTSPQAQSFVYSGTSQPAGVSGPYIDTTKVGADYKLKK
jgi:hypothetical protein